MRRVAAAVQSGALWAMLFGLGLLANLPWLAHAIAPPHERVSIPPVTASLEAIHATRRAERAGAFTVLIAGNSVVLNLVPALCAPKGHGAVAYRYAGNVYALTAYVRRLIDLAPADVVLVPVSWHGFRVTAQPPRPPAGPADWADHPHDAEIRREGWHAAGVARQARLLLQDVLLPKPPGQALTEERLAAYHRDIQALSADLRKPPASPVQRLEALRAYGAARGVTVLYYFTPHNPRFFDTMLSRSDYDAFRAALTPHLFADFGDLVPRDEFYGDFVHVNEAGGERLSRALGAAVAAGGWPGLARSPIVPGLAARLRMTLGGVRDEAVMQMAALSTGVRRQVAVVAANVGAHVREYPRYFRTVLGRPERSDALASPGTGARKPS